MDLIAALSSLKTASEVVKAIRAAEKSLDEATLKQRLADVTVALADGRVALAEVQEVLAGKDKEISELKAAIQQIGELVEGPGGYYYLPNEDGTPKGAPVCPKCKAEGRVMQTVQSRLANKAQCPTCKNEYQPVSIYLPSGVTAAEETSRRRKEIADQSRAVNRNPFGRDSWMRR
ncbi:MULTISPECIES: zinc finger-like domain-containing protein [Sphingobium]|uniref:zinc finger-like domain-containing protein n=1 Tax=Sphingobium TaxID=165695 RepID=UPI000DBB5E46|nr:MULTISPECIES: zinc finger-like domain-containing protein [Sphingobium]KAA9019286.1 hypothetical protein F4U94_03910 [Sphingobium limneticum]BBD01878.1 hypothetical protein YGS_C1P3133 [Sphingobium sp. YG1]